MEDISYIDINDNDDKSLKNISAQRKIPIHSKLIEIGFLDFVNKVKESGSDQIFSSLKKERDGHGTAASKWFGRFKQKLDLEQSEKKAFHSLRHNFSDALKAKNVSEPIAAQLIGHKLESITYGLYGSEVSLKPLKENIEKISYEIPELKKLKYTDI